MSLTHHNFSQAWDPLRAKKSQLKQILESIRVRDLRGISDLQINLGYPVTVIAGTNGSGKSTALFVRACAYDVPGTRDYSPAVLKARDMISTRHIPRSQSIQQAQVDLGPLNGFIGARGVVDETHTKRMGVA